MKIKVLASGSKGNCVYLESKNAKILIDVGINYNRIISELDELNVRIDDIDGIIISHIHSDHIQGLKSVTKHIKPFIYIKKELKEELKKIVDEEELNIVDDTFKINDLDIEVLNVSHDVPNSGYIIDDGKTSLVYMTDTGYINRINTEKTKNKTIYIIESNHNEKMLMEGKYPYMLKQRVIGDKGHLSNSYTARYLKKSIGENTKYIVLAHLSENNNTKELAFSEVKEELDKISFDDNNLLVASQKGENVLITV